MFHDAIPAGDYVKCLLSFVGQKESDTGQILYDYQNAVDVTFSVWREDGRYQYLPFDVAEYGVTSSFGTDSTHYYKEYLESQPIEGGGL